MRILVTGAAGFLGSHLVDRLLSLGHTVVGVDNFVGGYVDNVVDHPALGFFRVDICDLQSMTSVMVGCNVVYHCAALAYEGLSVFSPVVVTQSVVMGSVTVMTAAIRAGVKRAVNCSSMARYGYRQFDRGYSEIDTPLPIDPYGIAKLTAERQLTLLGQVHGVEVVHAVPHNIVGPRQKYDDPYRNVASIMTNLMLQGKRPIVYGDGSQQRCFSDVEDVLPVLVQMLDCPLDDVGEVFNVGPDEVTVTIKALCQKLCYLTGAIFDPVYADPRPCEVHQAFCSSDKIRKRFGFKQKVSLDESLQKIVDYVKERGTRPFEYHLPLEIVNDKTPKTWKERMF